MVRMTVIETYLRKQMDVRFRVLVYTTMDLWGFTVHVKNLKLQWP